MVKGVNKRVVEVNHPDCDCFDKAVFYVSADKSHLSERELAEEARRYLESLGLPRRPSLLERMAGAKLLLILLAALAAAAVACALILL